MSDYKKIAEEIKSKGFAVEKCEMNDEIPDEWVMFSVWFYLQQNFYVDLDWKTSKYYFYIDSGKEAIKIRLQICIYLLLRQNQVPYHMH